MWCKHCRQDAPSIRSASRHGMCCGRCGVPFSGESKPAHPAEVGLDLDVPPTPAATSYEDWQLDQSVRAMQARFEPWKGRRPERSGGHAGSRRPQWRLDAAHAPLPRPHKPKRRAAAQKNAGHRSPTFTQSALLLGLVASAGGVGVLGWSVSQSRGDVWNIGLSAVVAGGVVFLFGLVLQLERIWHNSRFAVVKLRQIDIHLQDLERTTSMLGVTQGPASQAFYSHMADGANPHLLLSDLKGQIDLLAMNFARQ